jgi:ADP-heptose:LPS heptosyltransferase
MKPFSQFDFFKKEDLGSLILAAGSLGDALITLPAIRLLQNRTKVILAGTSPYCNLGSELLGVNQVVSLDPILTFLHLEKISANPMHLYPPCFQSSVNFVYCFLKTGDYSYLSSLPYFKKTCIVLPSEKFDSFLKRKIWAGLYWTDMLKDIKKKDKLNNKLIKNQELFAAGQSILSNYTIKSPLILHPGSGSTLKNPSLHFLRSVASFISKNFNQEILVIYGEAEDPIQIQKAFSNLDHVKILKEIVTLKQLAGIFWNAKAYIGNDSGVSHLASACGLKSFVFFQTTNPNIWSPLFSKTYWLPAGTHHLTQELKKWVGTWLT